MTEDPGIGGQGLPHLVAQASTEYITGADFSFGAFALATHGAAKMIEIFGTQKQKELYLRKMYSGEWGGIMVLTKHETTESALNLISITPTNGYLRCMNWRQL